LAGALLYATHVPFHTSSTKKLNVTNPPIITVTGKAYFDVGHAPKDQSNRRKYLPGYAAWEIHPVMKIGLLTEGLTIRSPYGSTSGVSTPLCIIREKERANGDNEKGSR
jgi:hypothetical protein